MSLCLLCMCEKVYLSYSIVDWRSAYDAREAVCGCACLSLPGYGVSFAVRVMTYLFWINLLFVCNTTGFLSLSLISPLVYLSNSHCLFFLCLHLSVLLCLLSAAAAFCVKSTRHLAEVGITPLLSLYTNREDTFWQLSSSVSMSLAVCVRACVIISHS